MAFRKNGLLYESKTEYDVENNVDHQIRRIKQRRISRNIDDATQRYVQREKERGCLRWNP